VAAQNGSLVPIPGFDEAMMLLSEALGFEVPDQFVRDRAEARARRIGEQVLALKEKLDSDRRRLTKMVPSTDELINATTMPLSPVAEKQETLTANASEADALSEAMKKTMRRTSGALRWWQWQEKADAASNDGERDRIYQDAISALPDSYELLGNYANFLTDVCKDHNKAEEYYIRSLAANSAHANHLGNYAVFLTDARKNYTKAEEYFIRSLAADPTDADHLGNYASLLLATGRSDEGLVMLDRALALPAAERPSALLAELRMYETCHRLPADWLAALSKLKTLLTAVKITTGDWDFSGVIQSAKKRGHPDAEWLDRLAAVCAGTSNAVVLEGWEAWEQA
jgi:Tfp pilus assembly protein PilF